MTPEDFGAGMSRIESVLAEVERTCREESLPLVRELVRLLLDVHRLGMVELLRAISEGGPNAEALVKAAARRPVVESLLLMHELHPEPLTERVERAVREANDVAPGAVATLSRVDGHDAFVRIGGKAAAAGVLRKAVERTVCERAPDATLVITEEVEEAVPSSGQLVPMSRLRRKARAAG